MPRKPRGERALTGAERQAAYQARQAAKAAERQAMAMAPLRGPLVNLDHLVRWPERVLPWLAQRLGRDATLATADRLRRLGEAMPAPQPLPPDED